MKSLGARARRKGYFPPLVFRLLAPETLEGMSGGLRPDRRRETQPATGLARLANHFALALLLAVVGINLFLLGSLIPGVATRHDSTAGYRQWVASAFGRASDLPVPQRR